MALGDIVGHVDTLEDLVRGGEYVFIAVAPETAEAFRQWTGAVEIRLAPSNRDSRMRELVIRRAEPTHGKRPETRRQRRRVRGGHRGSGSGTSKAPTT